MSKRTLILIAFLTVLTAFFLYLALTQNQQKQPPAQQTTSAPTKKPIPAYTTLQVTPEKLSLSSNSGSLDIMINTGTGNKTNAVTAVQLELQYDPKMITGVTIVPGTFISNATPLVNTIDQTTGRITYALAISPSGTGVTGKGRVVSLRFQSLIPNGSSTTVSLLPSTLVTAQGIGDSVLLKATSATISVGPVEATP